MKIMAVLMIVAGIFTSSQIMAGGNTGTIVNFHLNSSVAGRGVCFNMSPSLDGTGWACLYRDNPLYTEMTTLIMSGYMAGKTCDIRWDTEDVQMHKIVRLAECR